jgi:Putative prokaryotic signal transducing protein
MYFDSEEIAKGYRRMFDDELLKLAQSYDQLTDTAQAAMRAEFARRSLEPPIVEEAEVAPERRALVTVARYRDLSEAIVVRTMLESAGIYVFLRDENLVRLDWQVSNFIGGIRLQVDARDEARATELLSQSIPDVIPFDEEGDDFFQPQCPKCGSIDITFQGSSRGAALASVTMLALPLPLGRETWICKACEARWEDVGEESD